MGFNWDSSSRQQVPLKFRLFLCLKCREEYTQHFHCPASTTVSKCSCQGHLLQSVVPAFLFSFSSQICQVGVLSFATIVALPFQHDICEGLIQNMLWILSCAITVYMGCSVHPVGLERSWCDHCNLGVVFMQVMNGGCCMNLREGEGLAVHRHLLKLVWHDRLAQISWLESPKADGHILN